MAGLNFGRKGSSGGFMLTGQGIWVGLTENRQMVLGSCGGEKRDELENPSSLKTAISWVYGDEHASWEEARNTSLTASLDGALTLW